MYSALRFCTMFLLLLFPFVRQRKESSHAIPGYYTALGTVSRAQNILSLNACIGYPEKEDDYLALNSVRFHEHMGYSMAGKFHNCGYKFGNWYHMVWMEKQIGEHSSHPAPVIPFSELNYRGVEDGAKGTSPFTSF